MRKLYGAIFWLLLPLILCRLWWRGRQQPGYRQHWGERFGRYRTPVTGPAIWLHAVSVGETRAAASLVQALRRRYPAHRLILTQMTPTGRDTARELYKDDVEAVYLPYDLPFAIDGFIRHFRPAFGLLMETEIWPNLIHATADAGIPLFLVNARLSARSARGYGKITRLVSPALARLAGVAAQSKDDAQRLAALGAAAPVVCGNVKFDIVPPATQLALGRAWRESIGERAIVLFASTRDGEETLLLDAWCRKRGFEQALLIVVPRHPQRFDEVANQVAAHGLSLCRRSSGELPGADRQVWLGDSMGELAAYYAAADIAVVGGSFLPLGGQNLIEASAVGTPVIVGPHMFNFAEATRLACEAGAAQQCEGVDAAVDAVLELLRTPARRTAMQHAAMAFSRAHGGATERIMAMLPELKSPLG